MPKLGRSRYTDLTATDACKACIPPKQGQTKENYPRRLPFLERQKVTLILEWVYKAGNKLMISREGLREKNLSLTDYLLLQGIFSTIPPNWKLPRNDGENTNNQTDEIVLDDDVQDITRMTSKSIYSTLVKRIQIPPTAQSKFNSLYKIFLVLQTGKIFINCRVKSLLTPEQEPFNTRS